MPALLVRCEQPYCYRDAAHNEETGIGEKMPYDMYAALNATNLVREVGMAVPEPAFIKFRASPALHARSMGELLACVRDFVGKIGLTATVSMTDLDDYFRAMAHNQAFGAPGTTPGNGTIWLFLLARELQPRVIVESGVWSGSSLFTLRNAVPDAKLFAFDLDFGALVSRLPGVDYRQHDWGTDNVRAEGASDLCFFDDHTNNCMRIRQSYERGFKHVIVDDAPDVGEIQEFRYPAVPSVSMIENDKWAEGDTIEWNWKGRRLRYTFRTEDTFGAKELIEGLYRFPSLNRWTGMEDGFHYFVRLKA